MFSNRLRRLQLQQIRLFRTLRFKLASTYLLLLAIVLTLAGFGGTKILRSILENQSEQLVSEKLAALKYWIHFDEQGKPYWFVDHTDPESEAAVSQLESIFVVADLRGNVQLGSTDPALEGLWNRKTILADLEQIRTTGEPRVKLIIGKDKVPYQIVSNIQTDADNHRQWYVAEGRSMASDLKVLRKFQGTFLIFLPISLLACALVSWYSAGRALKSLQSVEQAAKEITGSNLGLQIRKRGADDELDRLIGSFNEMSRRLKSSFDQIRQFSTDVSHELRTPLTAIQGQLEVALFTAKNEEDLRQAIENALQDVERLANLIRGLLLLSQAESGRLPLKKSVVELNALIHELIEQFQIPAEAQQVKLIASCTEPVICEVDPMQMDRVVANLLSNAIKYTPAGGWVRASAENDGPNVRIVVEDSGIGIPASHLPHIFNRFYRVPDANPEKGLGLGLSFVASIVKAHGGDIQVKSEVGKGSRFEVSLPAGEVQRPAETANLAEVTPQQS